MIEDSLKPGFLAPRGTLDKKPRHGQPCNSCGLCCVATLCPLGRSVFNRTTGPCPALSYKDGRSQCGLIVQPMTFARVRALTHGVAKVAAAAVLLIGAGLGCDARFNGEQPDEAFYGRLRIWDRENRSKTNAAKRIWGIR